MISKIQAINTHHRQIFTQVSLKKKLRGEDSSELIECRVNGKCKTWKTRPNEFQLPVKYGLKECFYITQDNAGDWNLAK